MTPVSDKWVPCRNCEATNPPTATKCGLCGKSVNSSTARDALLKTLAWLQDQPRARYTTPRYGGTDYDEHDIAAAHELADKALLEYINDEEITAAYELIDKWYS